MRITPIMAGSYRVDLEGDDRCKIALIGRDWDVSDSEVIHRILTERLNRVADGIVSRQQRPGD